MANDFAGIGLLKTRMQQLARVPSQAVALLAPRLQRRLKQQGKRGTDPYGKPHAPLKRQRRSGRSGPPLVDSGLSYAATVVKTLAGAGLTILLGGHLRWHLRRTKNRPARPALPLGAEPAEWRRDRERSEREAFGRVLGK